MNLKNEDNIVEAVGIIYQNLEKVNKVNQIADVCVDAIPLIDYIPDFKKAMEDWCRYPCMRTFSEDYMMRQIFKKVENIHFVMDRLGDFIFIKSFDNSIVIKIYADNLTNFMPQLKNEIYHTLQELLSNGSSSNDLFFTLMTLHEYIIEMIDNILTDYSKYRKAFLFDYGNNPERFLKYQNKTLIF